MRILNTYTEQVPPDDILSPAEIEEICCEQVPVDECSETGKVSPYEGADDEHLNFDPDEALEQTRANNPDSRILSVRTEAIGGPRPGEPCGELHESWERRLNCCDGVPPIVWSQDDSAEVLADFTSGTVSVTGGIPPYHWMIRGQGFTLGVERRRDLTTDGPSVIVNADDACGWGPITVTDGCSTAAGGVRSTNGQWILQPDDTPCPWLLPASGNCSGAYNYEGISGEYRVVQNTSLLWAYGEGNTNTFCGQCQPTQPYWADSCFYGWANSESCGLCGANYGGSSNCQIQPHLCQYPDILGTYCYDHRKSIFKWRC